MERNGYFNQKSLEQDAKRIFELTNFIQDGLAALQIHNAWEISMETATAIYTARLAVEHPDFDNKEVTQ